MGMLQLISVVCMTLLDATLSERFWQALLQLHSKFSLPAWSSQQSHKVIARHHFAAMLMACKHTGEFICLGGTDGKATLCTQNGTVLSTLADRGSWVWCVRGHPKKNCVAVGCQDGSIAVYQLLFSTVHGLYSDLYAYRLTLNYLFYEMTCVASAAEKLMVQFQHVAAHATGFWQHLLPGSNTVSVLLHKIDPAAAYMRPLLAWPLLQRTAVGNVHCLMHLHCGGTGSI